jgi:hypothetical protein
MTALLVLVAVLLGLVALGVAFALVVFVAENVLRRWAPGD